jgi:hypothetical protein
MSKVRVYAVEPRDGVEQLQVPLWFWNSAEWSAFTQASTKASFQNKLMHDEYLM